MIFADDFAEEIDREARRLLQILPVYHPGVGRVSPQCKRHADIFYQELAKFTLWALKSKSIYVMCLNYTLRFPLATYICIDDVQLLETFNPDCTDSVKTHTILGCTIINNNEVYSKTILNLLKDCLLFSLNKNLYSFFFTTYLYNTIMRFSSEISGIIYNKKYLFYLKRIEKLSVYRNIKSSDDNLSTK